MDEAVLANSKGATYMSFILDVEVVIKRDGKQANLAEHKLKGKTQSSKDNENEKKTSQPKSTEDTAVYTIETNSRNIFKGGEKYMTTDDRMSSFINIPKKDVRNKGEKENQDELISYDFKNNCINSSPRKKRRQKLDRKSRVFKGKIEAIDFLECNRIFMCNYLRTSNLNSANRLPCYKQIYIKRKLHSKFTIASESVSYSSESTNNSIGDTSKRLLQNTSISNYINKHSKNQKEANLMMYRDLFGDIKGVSSECNLIFTERTDVLNVKTPDTKHYYSHENLVLDLPKQNCIRPYRSMPKLNQNQTKKLNRTINIHKKNFITVPNNLNGIDGQVLIKRTLSKDIGKTITNELRKSSSTLKVESKNETIGGNDHVSITYSNMHKFGCSRSRREQESIYANEYDQRDSSLNAVYRANSQKKKLILNTTFQSVEIDKETSHKTILQRIHRNFFKCFTTKCSE